MKTFKIGLCFLDEEENIIVKKLLNSPWSVDLENDLGRNQHDLVRNEIAEILTQGVKLGISTEVIKEMLEELDNNK